MQTQGLVIRKPGVIKTLGNVKTLVLPYTSEGISVINSPASLIYPSLPIYNK